MNVNKIKNMKTLFLSIATLLFSITGYAQINFANLDFFVGTWKYEDSVTGDELTVKFKRSHYLSPRNEIIYCIVCAYTYKKYGSVVTDCMNKFDAPLEPHAMPIYASNTSTHLNLNELGWLYMFFDDYGRFSPNGTMKRTHNNQLVVLSRYSPYQIQWTLEDQGGFFTADEMPPDDFSVPANVVLTKQP